MRISLDLLLELNSNKINQKDLKGYITAALKANPDLQIAIRKFHIGPLRQILSLREVKQAGGRARVASQSAAQRKAAALRAARARWNT